MNTKTEERMLIIWKKVFNNPDITYEDSFFEIGGNSVYAMLIINEIEGNFQVEIPIADLLECENVRQLSAVVDQYIKE